MSLHISSSTISKLGHEILEIRLRALRHLKEKFKRSQELNEDLIFSPGNLIKHLIRWFGQHPLSEEDTVLKLIINILKSKYGPEAVHYLTKERLMKEFRKVEKILTNSEHQSFVSEIFKILDGYPSTEDTYGLKSLGCDDSLESNVSSNAASISEILLDDTSDYETPWSILSIPDYNSLKLLSESLTADNEDDLKHAFSYLEAAIDDYPAEYFLQPPYIFNSLLLLTKKDTIKTEALLHVLAKLTKSLSGRIKERQLSKVHVACDEKNKGSSSGKQITTQRYSIVLFNLCIEFYKQSSEDLKQPPPARIYWLQQEILDVIANDFHEYDFRNLFLIDLGNLAKYFRHSYTTGEAESNLSRILYIYMLKMIVELLDIESKKHIQLIPYDESRNVKYYPENYMSASATNNLSMDHPETWMIELECALFDLPLKEMYPELYEQVKLDEKHKLFTLLECECSLRPTLDIMKNLESFSSEKLIVEGSKALNTLLITKNVDFAMKLIGAIIDCLPRYEGNCKLRKAAEESLLKLLSHEDVPIRRSVYRECCSKVKQFFADAMNGEIPFNTHSISSAESIELFGIPLTNQILNNIINYGYFDDDTTIKANAEMILILILKAKPILSDRWQRFLGIIFPNLALLQCTTSVKQSGLSVLLLKLYDPDDKESGLSRLENLRGNLRFMFSKDESIRIEGLSRIIYLISTQQNAELWIPNVRQICDVILNDVCILKSPRNAERMFTRGLYDKGTVVALLELLRSPDVEPAIRKTTLLQLNVMCQDAELVDFVHDQNGWSLALQALENALKKDGAIDYPDAAIPAVGIICKITLCRPELRRAISEEIEVYYLLIRALFAFPYEEAFKHDCISTIFLLVFSSLIIGSKRISIPVPCSELQTPVICSYYSQNSKNVERSPLEHAYADVFVNKANNSPSACLSNLDLHSTGMNHYTSVMDCVLMYLRLQFATMWCDGFENILNEYNGTQSTSAALTREYNKKQSSCLASLRDFLQYNPDLIIKHSDIESIRICSQNENLKQFLYDVSNAVTHENVLDSIAKIQLCISISRKMTSHQQKNLLNSFKRFIMAAPKCNRDVILFKNIIALLTYLITAGNQDTLFLTLMELRSKHCVFLNILNKDTFSTCLYRANCKFLQSIVKQCIYHGDQNEINSYLVSNKNGDKFNFYNSLFENGLKVLEDHFRNREIDCFRVVLNLMQFVSASNLTDLDACYAMSVAKKMIDFIIKLKSFSQTGSHINKNVLLIVRNIIQDVNEIVLEEVYLKYLSGLCAHQDYKIRAISWCILTKISCSLKGAYSLVKALSFLPGGFHACCLSSLLDTQEAPVVRAAAGGLLANLLTYTKDTAGRKTINISVAPLCSNMKALESEDGIKLLLRLFNTHRFYDLIDETLANFYVSDVILYSGKEYITTCDIVKSYCSILVNLVELHPELLLQYFEQPCFQKLFDIVKDIPLCTTESSLSMLAEICHLLTKFIQADECLTENILARSQNWIKILLDLLNWDLYETTSKTAAIQILQVLKIMPKESAVYLVILENILNSDCEKILEFIFQSIACNDSLLQRSCLDWVHTLLTKGQTHSQNFARFIETTKIRNVTNLQLHKKTAKRILEMPNAKTASEVLFLVIYDLFVSFEWNVYSKHSCEKQKTLASCSEALCALLKTCRLARVTAARLNFLQYILDQLQNIFDEMGMSCADFIRKNGDAKKQPVIDELIFMLDIILNWYYEEMLTDEKQIMDLTKILLNAWPWINHSGELRISFVTLLAFLSENSLAGFHSLFQPSQLNHFPSIAGLLFFQADQLIEATVHDFLLIVKNNQYSNRISIRCLVCKQFSTTVPGHSTTVLQQLISLLIQETGKGKTSQTSLSMLEIGLRAISNCCSCVEGRLQSIKFNVLDIFDKFHPSVTKSQKSWNPIIILWLKYWEVFSRYPEGATIRNMHLLCILIAKSTKDIRYQCLTILRNMAFLNSNRAALCSSEDFLYTSKSVLSDGTRAEQTLVLVAIWRLIAGNCKAKHAIKSTSLPKLIKIIYNDVQKSIDGADNDNFLSILEILVKILDQ